MRKIFIFISMVASVYVFGKRGVFGEDCDVRYANCMKNIKNVRGNAGLCLIDKDSCEGVGLGAGNDVNSPGAIAVPQDA